MVNRLRSWAWVAQVRTCFVSCVSFAHEGCTHVLVPEHLPRHDTVQAIGSQAGNQCRRFDCFCVERCVDLSVFVLHAAGLHCCVRL